MTAIVEGMTPDQFITAINSNLSWMLDSSCVVLTKDMQGTTLVANMNNSLDMGLTFINPTFTVGMKGVQMVNQINYLCSGIGATRRDYQWWYDAWNTLGMTITGNVCIIGDSTIQEFQNGLPLKPIGGMIRVTGTLTDLSAGGQTINGQLTRWNALSGGVKSAINYVFVQIGINDINNGTISEIMARYQTLIDTINTDAPQAIVIGCTLIPCRGSGDYGGALYPVWQEMIASIMGIGTYAVTGLDRVCFSHTADLSDGDGYLLDEYAVGDTIHENNLGRLVIARSWYASYLNIEVLGPELIDQQLWCANGLSYWDALADSNWSGDGAKLNSDGSMNGLLQRNSFWEKYSMYKTEEIVSVQHGSVYSPYDLNHLSYLTISTSGEYTNYFAVTYPAGIMSMRGGGSFIGSITALSIKRVINKHY
jgi:lysophospholipase L1-like esterase